jgi:hypothetical protein
MARRLPVKRIGNIRISHIEVPFAAWIEEIPRRATSDDVSKPKPNITKERLIRHLQGLATYSGQ